MSQRVFYLQIVVADGGDLKIIDDVVFPESSFKGIFRLKEEPSESVIVFANESVGSQAFKLFQDPQYVAKKIAENVYVDLSVSLPKKPVDENPVEE